MTSTQIVPLIVVPLIAWRVYSRMRRNIGRQPFRPRRLVASMIFFSVLTVLFGLAAMRTPAALGALGGGLLLAVPLAFFGLKLTKFEATPEGKSYTPNTALGVALIVLLIGRILYRIVVLVGSPPVAGTPPAMFQSPVTLLCSGLTAGYYITYGAGVLARGKRMTTTV
jgi:hypothetical protein